MTSNLHARFTRKPYDINEVLYNDDPNATPQRIEIEFSKELTETEYDEFASLLLADRDVKAK
ncbi:hypothetical protein AGMMS50225_28910 [Betaproteobacteria bacterium]|nr:hypothetical protein AGMMS50225_28910 [Betaproteobacteria bacterium]